MPPSPGERGPAPRRAVFYNRAMALDRDLGVAVLSAWGSGRGRPGRGWEMLAATGARGLRLRNETEALGELHLTEWNPEASEVLRSNAAGLSLAGVSVEAADARKVPAAAPYDYVDLDPFGTPVPFLDAALTALAPEGLLAVTATDMPVLAGVQPGACNRRYGADPLRGRLASEAGLRILLAHVVGRAAEKGIQLRPVLSYVLDHHVRMYLRRREEPVAPPIEQVPSPRCASPPLPGGGPYGPLWVGPLFEQGFVARLRTPTSAELPEALDTLLQRFRGESLVDVPFYYEPNRLAHATAVPEPPGLEALFREISARGFRVARCHVQPSAFRTDAPYPELESIVRQLAGAR
ncbi:MAG TPA: hypothetical protein VGV89_06585 [Thermoplasmata archaeon]|nr:hypothetical protein [Thermoplasmata archaeon]